MTLDELKENISTNVKQLIERAKETAVYHQLSDRFENMRASQQRLTIIGSVLLLIFLLLVTPVSSLLSANSSLIEFETQRDLIRELIKVQREVRELPSLPDPPSADSLRALAEAKIKESNLLPEQIKAIETAQPNSRLISPNHLQSGVNIKLAKLNIRQIVDIGSKLQDINPSVKMIDIVIDPDATDPRYLDVTYRMISLNIPHPPAPVFEAPEKPNRKKSKSKDAESDE